MNNIRIFLKTSGSLAEMYKDFALFEGSYRSAGIDIYVPKVMLAAGSGETDAVRTGAILFAPNGARVTTEAYGAAYVNDETVSGIEYSVYTQVVPQVYTQYAGTQKLVVNVVVMSGEGETGKIESITTSQTVPFVVLPSARLGQDGSDPPIDPSQIEQIEGQVNSLGKRVTANEGNIDQLQSEVESMQNAAGDFEAYIGKQIQFVPSVDDVTDPDVIYGIVSDADANLFDLYILKNGSPVRLGSANLIVNTTTYYSGVLSADGWSGNAQTLSVKGLTDSDDVVVVPIDRDAAAYVEHEITATAVGENAISFTCGTVPNTEIALIVGVTKKQEIPTATGYYTSAQTDALFRNYITVNSETLIIKKE